MHNKDKKMSNIQQPNSERPADGLAQNPMLNAVAVSEGEISKALNRYFVGNCRYKLANAFIFKSDWESDFFVQKQNGYSYEFEVKISRSDFFADKKKVSKHLILSNGKFVEQKRLWNNDRTGDDDKWIIEEKEREHSFRPNKFFYVVPTGMITVDELPKYAGLFYYGEGKDYSCGLKKIKDAPFIHKEALKFESVLCNKFYNYWLNAKIEISQLTQELERLKSGSNGI
jgi:hypothetical protein